MNFDKIRHYAYKIGQEMPGDKSLEYCDEYDAETGDLFKKLFLVIEMLKRLNEVDPMAAEKMRKYMGLSEEWAE